MTFDTSSSVTGFEAINLIQNLEHRSGGNDLNAITNSETYTTLSQETCYKVDYVTIKA